MKRLGLGILILWASFSQAQIQWKISADSILFGQQLQYEISARADSSDKVVFPSSTVFAPLESVKHKTDTLPGKIKRIWYLTAWDSGRYVIPALAVKINDSVYHTDSISVFVSSIPVDTTGQGLFGYKGIVSYDQKSSLRLKRGRYWYGLIPLILLAAVWIVYRFYFRRKISEKQKSLSPYEQFSSIVKGLKPDTQSDPEKFYVKLTDAFREYLESALNIPARESVSEQLLRLLSEYTFENGKSINPALVTELQTLFRRADWAKFAKHKPYPTEMVKDLELIRRTAGEVQQVLDEIDAVRRAEEALRLKAEKQEKRKHLVIRSVGGLVILALVVWVLTRFYGAQIAQQWEKGVYAFYQIPGPALWYESSYGSVPALEVKAPVIAESVHSGEWNTTSNELEEKAAWRAQSGKTRILIIALDFKENAKWNNDQILGLVKQLWAKNDKDVELQWKNDGTLSGHWKKDGKTFVLTGKLFDAGQKVRVLLVDYPEGSQIWKNLADRIIRLSGLENTENKQP